MSHVGTKLLVFNGGSDLRPNIPPSVEWKRVPASPPAHTSVSRVAETNNGWSVRNAVCQVWPLSSDRCNTPAAITQGQQVPSGARGNCRIGQGHHISALCTDRSQQRRLRLLGAHSQRLPPGRLFGLYDCGSVVLRHHDISAGGLFLRAHGCSRNRSGFSRPGSGGRTLIERAGFLGQGCRRLI